MGADCVNYVTANSAIVPCVDGHNGQTVVADSAQDQGQPIAPHQATTTSNEGNFHSFVLDQINLVIKEVKDKKTTENSFFFLFYQSRNKKNFDNKPRRTRPMRNLCLTVRGFDFISDL